MYKYTTTRSPRTNGTDLFQNVDDESRPKKAENTTDEQPPWILNTDPTKNNVYPEIKKEANGSANGNKTNEQRDQQVPITVPTDEEKKEQMKLLDRLKQWVVYTSDPAFYYWLGIISVAITYNVFLIIARCVFDQLQTGYTSVWLPLDVVSYILYILDMIVQFRTGYLEHGLVVTDGKKLAKNYVKTWAFKLDTISILPFEILYIYFGVNTPLLRINRLFKINRLLEFFDRTLRRTSWPNALKISTLLFYIIIIVHWNACCYFAISKSMGLGSDPWVYPPDIAGSEPNDLSQQYMYSFYWSCLTLLTIGETPHPQKDVQYIFVVLDYLIGVLIFASIVGNVGSIITNMNETRADFQRKLDNVKQYLDIRHVDQSLEKRVLKWFDYLWANKQSLNENSIMSALPDKLRAEIALHVHLQTMQRVALFQDCDPGLLKELVLKLRLSVFSPGDYVCRKGDIGRDMYIVKRGLLTVVADDGTTVIANLSEGSVFGEISLLSIPGSKLGNRRAANVRSEGYCDVFVLSKEDLWETLKEYPEARSKMVANGRSILLKSKQFDEELERTENLRQQHGHDKMADLGAKMTHLQVKVTKMMQDFNKAQGKFKDRINTLEDRLRQCTCDNNPLANKCTTHNDQSKDTLVAPTAKHEELSDESC